MLWHVTDVTGWAQGLSSRMELLVPPSFWKSLCATLTKPHYQHSLTRAGHHWAGGSSAVWLLRRRDNPVPLKPILNAVFIVLELTSMQMILHSHNLSTESAMLGAVTSRAADAADSLHTHKSVAWVPSRALHCLEVRTKLTFWVIWI